MNVNLVFKQLNQMMVSPTFARVEIITADHPTSISNVAKHMFNYVKRGSGRVVFRRGTFPLSAGAVWVSVPNEDMELFANHELEIHCIEFTYWSEASATEGTIVYREAGADFPIQGVHQMKNHAQVLHLAEELEKSFAFVDEMVVFRQRLLLERLFYCVVQDLGSVQKNQNTVSCIEQTFSYIDQHFMMNVTLELLAKRAGVSPSYYSRMFRFLKGVSLSEYLLMLRMERAKELLALPHERLRDIAQSVGYNDEFYFSKMFKRKMGISPSEYLNRRSKTK
ncbi:helix-turn-helix transcriptional regulator [Brevibacillus sp. SYSU BS000544]|uniref:helix-turn-helix transcriptional regulator n=1 Tax=Brevibacillus sp. SYSU BS000544 TaxID=3416443 RepID=UPI003CE5C23F